MLFCEIIPKNLPAIKHACNADFRTYKNSFPNYYSFDLLEFCVCVEGRVVRAYPSGKTEIVYPGMLTPIFKDDVFDAYAFQGERQRHISIGVAMDYDIKHWDSEQEINLAAIQKRVEENRHILVPCNFMLEDQLDKFTHLMQKLVCTFASSTAESQLQALGEWFCISAFLTSVVLKELNAAPKNYSPTSERYVHKAITYIQSHYTEKLNLEEVAKQIDISAGHLSRVFREVTGMSVLDYINQHRINTLMNIVDLHKYTLKEASFSVGFDDPSYVSRLFKKNTGMTFRQFLAQRSEKEEQHCPR